MEQNLKKSLKIGLIFLVIGLLIGSLIVYAATPSSTFYISSGVYPGVPSFTVWREGSNYFAKDANGLIAYSGTNETIVTQNAIDNTDSGLVYLKGGTEAIPLDLTGTITMKQHVTLQFDCIRINHDNDGFTFTKITRANLIGDYIDTKEDYVGKAIVLNGSKACKIQLNWLLVRNGTGIYLVPHSNSHTSYNTFFINYIQVGTGTGIWMERAALYQCQHNTFHVDIINFYRNKGTGIYLNYVGVGNKFFGLALHLDTAYTDCVGINNTASGIPNFFGFTMQVGGTNLGIFNGGILNIFGGYLNDLDDITNTGLIHYIDISDVGTGNFYDVLNDPKSESSCRQSGTMEASNDDWIAHGLAGTPALVILTVNETDANYCIQLKATNSTHFQIYLYDLTAGAAETVDKTIHWYAEYQP